MFSTLSSGKVVRGSYYRYKFARNSGSMGKFEPEEHALGAVVDKRLSTEGGTLTESPKIANIHELVSDEGSSPAAKEVAVKILARTFKEVTFTEYANYLGAPGNGQVLREFLALLRPLPQSLVSTLRKLSNSIYFIAEAANIDMILEALAKQWLETHNVAHYLSDYKLCHIVLFSLLILNSDLHNGAASEMRFSCDDFVQNTIYALQKEQAEVDVAAFSTELAEFYRCLEKEQLPLLKPTATSTSRLTKRSSGGSSHSTMRKPSILSMRSSVALERSSSRQSLASNISQVTTRETHATINSKYRQGKPLEKLYLEEPFDLRMRNKNRTPWLMDALLLVQEASRVPTVTPQLHSNHHHGRKKKLFSWFKKHSRDSIFDEHAHLSTKEHWSRVRMRVAEGRLVLFYFKNSLSDRTSESEVMGWDIETCKRKSSQCRIYNLLGTLATLVQENIVASNGSESTPASFTLTFPRVVDTTSGLSLHFKADNLQTARNFTESCNFWSGRITPIPSAQIEMVSNAEYGWSPQLLDGKINFSDVRLTDWEPLMGLDAVFEDMDENIALWDFESQLYGLRIFTETLSDLIDRHNARKPRMIAIWSDNNQTQESQFERAMDNWNNKYLYLNKQYERHIVYLKTLKKAKDFYLKSDSEDEKA